MTELAYHPRAGAYDEVYEGPGATQPHWQPFLESLQALGMGELTRRWSEARQLIRENGVTYNIYGDPSGLERPWQLDPIPLLIAPAEAQALEAGLIQRGRLLEALASDLYGPQRSLQEGLLPPALVFANPAFLRPCHGVNLRGGHHLHLYAANVARGRDGSFTVLGDRTQAPSGAGYALENRIVLSRTLPDTFRDCQVQRLALFFHTLRRTLASLAPHDPENPRVVLLTPGPYNETYFEHSYLARYLGYPLVEGGDLVVRDNRVFLKLLGGLQPVDVIFRRLDDDFCDPLELRPDSFLGVPGLVQCVREGKVAIANALGSGLMQTPAFLAFLPGLCRALLGEELRLPSVPTWWCGEPMGLQHALAHLDQMVIKPAFPGRIDPLFAGELSRTDRAELADRLRARPGDFVAQECIPLSTAPVLVNSQLQPRRMVVRCYLAAADDSFVMMPGGLTRVGTAPESMIVSMQQGGGSKDTWVLAGGPVSSFSLLRPADSPLELNRGGSDLPSRAADSLFWLGRYVERADGLTRLLRCVLVRLTETSGLTDIPELPTLLHAIGLLTGATLQRGNTTAGSGLPTAEMELHSLIHDAQRPGSLAAVLANVARTAGTVRDRISADMWRVLRDSARGGRPKTTAPLEVAPRHTLVSELDQLDGIVLKLAAFGGLATESMTRAEGWRFLDLGRNLERALHLLHLLRATLSIAAPAESLVLEAVLEIADSSMTYRRRYQAGVQSAAVLDLLLADDTNPRSLAFHLAALAAHLESLPNCGLRAGPEQERIQSALGALRQADIHNLARVDTRQARPALEALLLNTAAALLALCEVISQHYLSHLQSSQQLGRDTERIT